MSNAEWMRTGAKFIGTWRGERTRFRIVEPLLSRKGWMCQALGTTLVVGTFEVDDIDPIGAEVGTPEKRHG